MGSCPHARSWCQQLQLLRTAVPPLPGGGAAEMMPDTGECGLQHTAKGPPRPAEVIGHREAGRHLTQPAWPRLPHHSAAVVPRVCSRAGAGQLLPSFLHTRVPGHLCVRPRPWTDEKGPAASHSGALGGARPRGPRATASNWLALQLPWESARTTLGPIPSLGWGQRKNMASQVAW